MPDKFVARHDIDKLVEDSFESLHARLAEAIETKKIFGEGIRNTLLGTFPKHCIVGSSDGRFAKVAYEQKEGQLKLTDIKTIPVKQYTESDIGQFVLEQARAAVESMLSGNKDVLSTKLSELTVVVDETPRMTDSEIADRLVLMVKEDRAWKKLFQEKKLDIKSAIIDQITKLDENRLAVKFGLLYQASAPGSISLEKHEQYRDLVNEDIKYLGDRLVALTDLVAIAMESVVSVKPATVTESTSKTFEAFEVFGSALLSDLTELCRIVVESKDRIGPVAALCKIYDAVAEELFNYEVAGRYVCRMASKICSNPA